MLELIYHLYLRAKKAVQIGIPMSKIKNDEILSQVIKMKYDIPNEDIIGIGRLMIEINNFFDALEKEYR